MTSRAITVDDEVFERLQSLAVPLVDDANTVLRRVLDLPVHGFDQGQSRPKAVDDANSRDEYITPKGRYADQSQTAGARSKQSRTSTRAPRGSLLPTSEYEIPLLETLAEFGGSGPTSDVVDRLGKKLKAKFMNVDRETISSGEIRWRNRVQFVRLGLIKEGLMANDSPRGTWEITDAGRERLAGRPAS